MEYQNANYPPYPSFATPPVTYLGGHVNVTTPLIVEGGNQKRSNKKPLYISSACTSIFLLSAVIFLILFFVKQKECTQNTFNNAVKVSEDTVSGGAYVGQDYINSGIALNLGQNDNQIIAPECFEIWTMLWCSIALFGLTAIGCCLVCCMICGYAFA